MNIFDVFVQAFTEENDEEKLIDIAQGLAALSKVQTDESLAVVAGMKQQNTGALIRRMAELLGSQKESLFVPALTYFGGILGAEDEQAIDFALEADIFERLMDNMHACSPKALKECLWTISNITASQSSTKYQRAFLQSSIASQVISLASSASADVAAEALWSLCNTVTCGGSDERRDLFSLEHGDCVPALVGGLSQKPSMISNKLILNILESLKLLLQQDASLPREGEERSVFAKLAATDIEARLVALAQHPQQKVFDLSQDLKELFMYYQDKWSGHEGIDELDDNTDMNGNGARFVI